MFKKLLVGLLVLVILVGGALYYTWSNLDHIIKMAIEKYGTAATQTTVSLDSVKLSLTSGEGALNGLSVDNPKNFSTAVKAFNLGTIAVKVDVNSLRGTGPIIIRQIDIQNPQVNYEITSGGDSNLSALQKNAEHYANSMGGNTTKAKAAGAKPPAQGGERKVIISDLVVHNGQLGITASLMNQTKSFQAPLPDIHLTNIGKDSNGATIAQVTDQLLSSITASAGKAATGAIAKNLGGLKDMIPLKGAAGDSLNNAGGQIKSLIGQ